MILLQTVAARNVIKCGSELRVLSKEWESRLCGGFKA
jgi:hypothetical protein